jgi:hypothetical protein
MPLSSAEAVAASHAAASSAGRRGAAQRDGKASFARSSLSPRLVLVDEPRERLEVARDEGL